MNSSSFYIFKSPMVVMQSFEWIRKLSNPLHRLTYSWYDKAYSKDKFMDGAVQAALLAALNLRERQFDKFREISTEKLTGYMQQRIPEVPRDLLEQRLQFKRHHLVNGFIHSSAIAHKAIHKKLQETNEERVFFSTFIFFIDRTPDKKWSLPTELVEAEDEERIATFIQSPRLSKLLKRPQEFLVCNMTLARALKSWEETDVGTRWRITDINFFDCELAFDNRFVNN